MQVKDAAMIAMMIKALQILLKAMCWVLNSNVEYISVNKKRLLSFQPYPPSHINTDQMFVRKFFRIDEPVYCGPINNSGIQVLLNLIM